MTSLKKPQPELSPQEEDMLISGIQKLASESLSEDMVFSGEDKRNIARMIISSGIPMDEVITYITLLERGLFSVQDYLAVSNAAKENLKKMESFITAQEARVHELETELLASRERRIPFYEKALMAARDVLRYIGSKTIQKMEEAKEEGSKSEIERIRKELSKKKK